MCQVSSQGVGKQRPDVVSIVILCQNRNIGLSKGHKKLITKYERLQALERQVQRLRKRLDGLNARSNTYSWMRLAIFLVGIALCIGAFFLFGWLAGLIIALIAVIAFSIVAYIHGKIERGITRHNVLLHIVTTHIARIGLDWARIPATNIAAPNGEHPFEIDLDITGERSLHQLLNTAVSYEGSSRLREWLLQTRPDEQTIRQRQALVQELAPMTRFRDRLTIKSLLTARSSAEQWEGKRLLAWLNQPTIAAQASLRTTLGVASILSIITIALIILNIVGLLLPQYWIIAVLVSLAWFFAKNKERGDMFDDTFFLRNAFAQISSVFSYLESYPYGKHTLVKQLCQPFFANREQRPSTLLRGISRLASMTTLEKNRVLRLIINALVPWDAYIAYRLHTYKATIGNVLPIWLDTWFELEALSSLANFAYLNPEYVLPAIIPDAPGTSSMIFQGAQLGHPLIPFQRRVVNDFTMNERGEVIIVTGSNMSGKSTFLRTVGINLCLAYAGGPVSASSLTASIFKLYTCIKVSDSVTENYSYFYAEVKRLKALLSALEPESGMPLFFLIDEIFKGTNNRERLIGSRAYIRALVGKNCMGMITTHDLELVKLADDSPLIRNYHFREDVIDGQMVFDYILHTGPCPTTNALKIMQMEGLPVK
jgi:ABC-type multidrug transport system fused ATPase/permease subunit